MKKEKIITVEKVVAGGLGLSHLPDGMVALIPYVLPGERVRIRVVRKKKTYVEALPAEIIEPSPDRVEPRCLHYQRCGGCDLQHASDAAQVQLKNAILQEHLLRGGIISEEILETVFDPPLASPRTVEYRQRIRLHVGPEGRFGFQHNRSHQIEPVRLCPLARPEINGVLAQMEGSRSLGLVLIHCKELELLLSPDDQGVVLVFHSNRKPRPADRENIAKVLQDISGVKGIIFSIAGHGRIGPFTREDPSGKKGQGDKLFLRFTLRPDASSREFSLSCEAGGFCQVNLEQNENLISCLLDWARPSPDERALDLFCGMGNFSLPLASSACEVVGMDLQRAAIRSAEKNAAGAGLANCRFEKSSAVAGARKLAENGEQFNMVLLDPPRQGCIDAVPYVVRLGAGRIVYISCDPATLVRDLAALKKHGYILERVRMIDMFPQTHHMETIALLKRQ